MKKFKDLTTRNKSNIIMIRNLIFFIALIIFTFWFLLKDQDLNELKIALKSADIKYLIIAIAFMFGVYLFESINVRSILKTLGEKKFSIFRALKYTAIGSFFSAITPAATGGQPVEIYYMSKDNIKAVNGTMAMLLQLCSFQISTLTYSIICAILNPGVLDGGIFWFYLLGLVINGVALALMLLGTFSNKIASKLANFYIKIMKKLNLKNFELRKKKLEDGLKQYSKSAKFIKNHKIEFVKSTLRVFIQIGLYHSIPYFIYKSFGLSGYNFLQIFSMQAILYTTVSGIPLPGSIGISETLFLKIYGSMFGKSLLNGAMLLYRFASFYLYIMIFSIVVVINSVKSKDKASEIDKEIKEVEKEIVTNRVHAMS